MNTECRPRRPSEHVSKHISIYCRSYRSYTLHYLQNKQAEKEEKSEALKIKIQRFNVKCDMIR